MDPFRLLSRSSNLRKSTPSESATVRHIPSAADTGNLERDPNDFSETAERSKKRKRHSQYGAHGDYQPQLLEYYSASSKTARSFLHNHATESYKSTEQRPENFHEATENQETLDQNACKRILKQNKLKITLLEAVSFEGRKRREKHRLLSSGTEASMHTAKAQAQLTTRPLRSFRELGAKYNVARRLAANLDVQGYKRPTEVQLGSLPLLLGNDKDRGLQLECNKKLEGNSRSEVDLLTIAPTGSGKTLAFLVHLMHGLRQDCQHQRLEGSSEIRKESFQALVLAPTHELVDQIANEGKKLAFGTGIRVSRMRKGMSIDSDCSTEIPPFDEQTHKKPADGLIEDHASKGSHIKADILISTPMLLLNAAGSSSEPLTSSLTQVRYLVLDEADVLLDPLFRAQTLGIWKGCTHRSLQTSLWSATIGSSIESLAQEFILDRRRRLGLEVGRGQHYVLRLIVGLKDSAVPNISHQLLYAATERGKLMALRQMIHPTAATPRHERSLQPPFLIFTQTIARATALHSELLYDIPPEAGGSSRIAVLHSDLSDTARSSIMAGFRKGEIWILVTTDLLARGIDFRGINGVVNYDIPNTSGIYVHRVGRTGRQGREGGVAVTLYTEEDIKYVKNVAHVIAASEKQRGKSQNPKGEDGLQQWLLDALPDVSKRTKQELKKTGVEARRTAKEPNDRGKEVRRMRISTKSGYDRRQEQKRRDTVAGSQRRSGKESSDEDWVGIGD
ncbi:MAG: hypothetical protein Q9171_003402 [Xanthocarpia ochracea]